MDLHQLKYFKAVATVGKISEAAESLFISAPALSTSIARLEKELGVRLFDRAGNRITLNVQGEIFLKYTNHILHNLESARQELRQSVAEQNHTVSVVSINSLMWVNMITTFASEFPTYTLSFSTVSTSKLAEEGFSTHSSFLLAYKSEIPPAFAHEFDSLFLFHTKPVVMLHKDNPLAEHSEVSIPMLKNEKLFLTQPGYSLNERIFALFEHYGLPAPTENYHSYLARQKMVSENLGVSFSSQSIGHAYFPNIRYIPLVDPFEPWEARLYWRKDRPLTASEELFRDFIQNFYSNLH